MKHELKLYIQFVYIVSIYCEGSYIEIESINYVLPKNILSCSSISLNLLISKDLYFEEVNGRDRLRLAWLIDRAGMPYWGRGNHEVFVSTLVASSPSCSISRDSFNTRVFL